MELYRVLHFLGVGLIVMSLGGVIMHCINGGSKESNSFRKGMMITHGVGMILVLVAGFGMLARLGIHSVPLWVGVKLAIWILFGGLVVVAYKKPTLGKLLWLLVPVLVMVASYVGRTHLG